MTSSQPLPDLPSVETPVVPSSSAFDAVQLPEDLSSKIDVTPSTSTSPIKRFAKNTPRAVLLAIGLFVLVAGVASAMFLVSKSSELRQQASGGYLDCAGGIKDGQSACSGFREVVICHNGALVPLKTCAASEKCSGGGCISETPTTGTTPMNSSGPSTLPSSTPSSGGSCGSGSNLFSGNQPAPKYTVGCTWEGKSYYKCQDGFFYYNGSCATYGDSANSCGSEASSLSVNVEHSSLCFWRGEVRWKCDTGYKKDNNKCVSETGVQIKGGTCGTGDGLFSANQTPPAHSIGCTWDGGNYFKCASGYINSNGGCVATSLQTDTTGQSENSCGTGTGLFGINDNISNSTACRWGGVDYRKCMAGYENSNGGCVSTNNPAQKYKLVGESCVACGQNDNAIICTYTAQTCNYALSIVKDTQQCHPVGNCILSFPRPGGCLANEYTSEALCRSAAQQANPSPSPSPVAMGYRLVGPKETRTCEQCVAGSAGCTYQDKYSCDLQAVRDQLGFVEPPPVDQVKTLCSGTGLFAGGMTPPTNSHPCRVEDNGSVAIYYQCNGGYHNENGGCVSNNATLTPVTAQATAQPAQVTSSSNILCYSSPSCFNPTMRSGACNAGEFDNWNACQSVSAANSSSAQGNNSLNGAFLIGE